MVQQNYLDRIGYNGDLTEVSKIICRNYLLGDFILNTIITTGYEDFNYILETSTGKYVVKIFAEDRDLAECRRYIECMIIAIEEGVKHPKLYKSTQGFLHIIDIDYMQLRLCVLEYIDGKDLYNIGRALNDKELKAVAQQVALINQIDLKPDFIYDSWAIVNFHKEFQKKKHYLDKCDLELIEPLYNDFKNLDMSQLSHCFVHGDILTTNVMKDKNNKLWIIDFACSNYSHRVIELAVIACNMCFDENDKQNSDRMFNILLEEYQKYMKLTKEEIDVLPYFIKLAHAMHIICASYQKMYEGNTSKENEYWLDQGRKGLRQEARQILKLPPTNY